MSSIRNNGSGSMSRRATRGSNILENWLMIYRDALPLRFNASTDKKKVSLPLTVTMNEENVLEGVLPLMAEEGHGSGFFSTIKSLLNVPTVNGEIVGLSEALLYFIRRNEEYLKNEGLSIEEMTKYLQKSNFDTYDPPHSVKIALAKMLGKDIVIYKSGRHVIIETFKDSTTPLYPPNTFFVLQVQIKSSREVFYGPLRLFQEYDLFSFHGRFTQTCNGIISKSVAQPPNADATPADRNTGGVAGQTDNGSNSALPQPTPRERITWCETINRIREAVTQIRNQQRASGVADANIVLSEDDIKNILQLIEQRFIKKTEGERFFEECGHFDDPNRFNSRRYLRDREIDNMLNDHMNYRMSDYELLGTNSSGHCFYEAISLYCYGSSTRHLYLRLLTIIVFLRKFSEFHAAHAIAALETDYPTIAHLLDLCIVEYDPNLIGIEYEYPGSAAIYGISYLLKDKICVLNGSFANNVYAMGPQLHSYKPEYDQPGSKLTLVRYYEHYLLIVFRSTQVFNLGVQMTMKGMIFGNTVNDNAVPSSSNITPDGPPAASSSQMPSQSQTKTPLNASAAFVAELNAEMYKTLDIGVTVTRNPPFKSPMDFEVFKSIEFVKTSSEAKYLISGVGVVSKNEPKLVEKVSPFIRNQELTVNTRRLTPIQKYTLILARFEREPKPGPLARVWPEYQHYSYRPQTFLHGFESPLSTSKVYQDVFYYYGIFGTIYPIQTLHTAANSMIYNLGEDEVAVLHIPAEEIPKVLEALKRGKAFGNSRVPLRESRCELFCKGKLVLTTTFLMENQIKYTFEILKPGGISLTSIGSLFQIVCLGLCHIQVKPWACANYVLLKFRENMKKVVHDCADANFEKDIRKTLRNAIKNSEHHGVKSKPTKRKNPAGSTTTLSYPCIYNNCVLKFEGLDSWISHWKYGCGLNVWLDGILG